MSFLYPSSVVRYRPGLPGNPLTYTMPPGVPDPIIWFSARDVTLNGSDEITDILNQGTGGATYDAVLNAGSRSTVSTPVGWGGREVFDIPITNGGYSFTPVGIRTTYGITTYKDGVDANFDDFDGYIDGDVSAPGSSPPVAIVGQGSLSSLFAGLPTEAFLNGVSVGSGASVLPLNKSRIGSRDATGGTVGVLWIDNFSISRQWIGYSGDIMMWTQQLTPTQIADVDQMLVDFYAEPVLLAAGNLTAATNPVLVSGLNVISFDNVVLDFNLSIGTPTTTLTAPTGTKYAVVTGYTRNGSVDGSNFYDVRLRKNGTQVGHNSWHDAFYSTGLTSGVFDCVAGDTFDLAINTNYAATLSGGNTSLKAAFYG